MSTPPLPPRVLDLVEDVPIETISVGDYVFLDADARRAERARCVLGLTTTRHRQTNRVIGWLVELEGGTTVWLRRGARVSRREAAERLGTAPIA